MYQRVLCRCSPLFTVAVRFHMLRECIGMALLAMVHGLFRVRDGFGDVVLLGI